MKKPLLFCYFIFFIFTKLVAIEISEKNLNILSNDKIWLKLIHNKNKENEILSKEFYLSKTGNPKDELVKTLDSYNNFESFKKDDTHPQCRFPARYYWLSKQINLPNYNELENFCQKLNKWPAISDTSSISVILVSGYLGNPASTFGHSFIKLNSKTDKENDLFDLSINYGALVPDNELIIKYIFKGIFGGYKAGFSDKYFYTQDLVYSHNEFRDMWDYELNLSEYEKKIILFHIWEIVTKKFDYFFLDKNCGYRVSEILELVTKESIIDNARVWYAPIETFNKLEELDEKYDLIKKVTYIPAVQKSIFKEFNLLSKVEKEIAIKIINNKYKNISNYLSSSSKNSQVKILDFLLELEKYYLVKDSKRDSEYKKILLMKRFSLPASKKTEIYIKEKKSPAKGNKPSIVSTSINHLDGFGYYPSLDFTAFAIESIGDNVLDYDELIVGNTSLGYKSNKLFLNYFDLIKIKKLRTINLPFEENYIPSWSLNIGSKTIYKLNKENDFFIDGGVGKVFDLGNDLIVYPFLNSSLHIDFPYIKITPNINANFKVLKTRNLISLGTNLNPYNKNIDEFIKLTSQYKISKNISLELNYEKESYQKTYLRLKYFF